MLARMTAADGVTVMAEHFLVKRVRHRQLLGKRRRALALARGEEARHLPRQPGTALRGAADHHRVGAGDRKRLRGVVEAGDVAVDDDRNGDRLFDRADGGPVGAPVIELAAGAAVHGDHLDAGRLRTAGKLGGVDAGVIPAEPHLQRDRHAHGGNRRLDQRERMVEVAHQRRAGGAVGDLLRRAAHIDIDDGGALRLGDAGALGHAAGFAAGQLHDMDGDPRPVAAQAGLALAFGQAGAGGHFRDHQARRPAVRRGGGKARR